MTREQGCGGQHNPAHQSSLWEATATPAPVTEPLVGHASADVVVIGGGLCGLSCALHLAEAGASVVLLEAKDAGWGASGRNGGQVIPCFKEDPDAMCSRLGTDLGERVSLLGASGGELVANLVHRYGIDCAYRRDGWILGLHSRHKLPALERRARQWQQRGRAVNILGKAETASLTGTDLYEAAYHDPDGGALNPLSFSRGLARAAMQEGVRLYSRSPATAVLRHNGRWSVRTDSGEVDAPQVVVATGAYSGDILPKVRRSVLPVQSIQIATPPLPEPLCQSILPQGHVVSDSRRLLLYFRRQEEGRLVFGGRGSLGGDKISAKHLLKLYEAMQASFPALGDIGVDYAWAGLVDITSDRHLRVHVPAPGLKIIIGFNGRGVAIAPAVGRAVASSLSSGSLQELPLPVSKLRPVPFHGLRLPAMALAVRWYRLRDWLGR